MEEGYRALANAIVLNAVKDWRFTVRKLRKRPRYEPAKLLKQDCETFFLSELFTVLTDCDGTILLNKLQEEENL